MGRCVALYGMIGVVLAGLLPAQADPAPAPPADLRWVSSVADAFVRAKAEKKPVLWVIMKDREIGCQRMLEKVYSDPQVVAKTARLVLLPCSTYLHEKITLHRDGRDFDSCPQFRGITCADHQAIEREMRARYEDADVVVAPQHIICDADGKVLERKRYEMGIDAFIGFLDKGLRTFRGEPEPSPAADGGPKAGPDAPVPAPAGEPPPEVRKLTNLLLTAPEDERVQATRDLAEGGDQVRVKALVDILSGSELKPDPLKARLIRAVGAQAYGAAAQHFTRLLELKSVHHRNCVVVTLEEMANPAASDALLELWKKEKDPEIRKDILRALGPAGAGKEPARDLLLKELKAKEESHRIAAAMALGSHLSGREDVRGALKERWKKESGNEILKIAILYAYFQSKDRDAGSDIDDLIADERNGEIKEVARLVRGTLGGGPPPDPGRGGRGGRFGRGGPQGSLLRALSRLYAADKIERNAVRDLRERFTGGR